MRDIGANQCSSARMPGIGLTPGNLQLALNGDTILYRLVRMHMGVKAVAKV